MPDEVTEGLEHEETLGPDDPGSMAYKLARAAEAPLFPVELSPEEIEAARQADIEAAQAAAAETAAAEAAENETPEEKAAREAAALEPKPKFETIEEYQKALKEAETRMHAATTEAAEARQARENLEAEVAEIRATQETEAAEAAKLVPKTERKAAYAAALKRIQEIPLTRNDDGEVVYPDNYDDQVAEAWASTAVDPHEVAKEAAKLAREELRQERQAEDTRTAAEKEEATRLQIRADAEKMAATQGLDMTPGSADYRLFYSMVDELAADPEHEYQGKPFEEQVKWATTGVRQVLGKKIELTDAERAAARRHQDRNVVLGRGLTPTPTPEPKKQRSMQEILGQ